MLVGEIIYTEEIDYLSKFLLVLGVSSIVHLVNRQRELVKHQSISNLVKKRRLMAYGRSPTVV